LCATLGRADADAARRARPTHDDGRTDARTLARIDRPHRRTMSRAVCARVPVVPSRVSRVRRRGDDDATSFVPRASVRRRAGRPVDGKARTSACATNSTTADAVERASAVKRRADAARRMRRRAASVDAGGRGGAGGRDARARATGRDVDDEEDDARDGWEDVSVGSGMMMSSASVSSSSPMETLDAYLRDDFVDGRGGARGRGEGGGGVGTQSPDDIITDAGQWPFEDEGDWLEPQYKEVNAAPGTMLEKVQRMHLNEPSDFSFRDGEYFDLMGYVKHKTDNEFCLVLEVAERARERKMERCESAQTHGQRLPAIQQVRRDGASERASDASSWR